jgi:hypothetical protein
MSTGCTELTFRLRPVKCIFFQGDTFILIHPWIKKWWLSSLVRQKGSNTLLHKSNRAYLRHCNCYATIFTGQSSHDIRATICVYKVPYTLQTYSSISVEKLRQESDRGINGEVQRLLHSSALILLSSRVSRRVGLLRPAYDHCRPIYTVIMQIVFQNLRNISGGKQAYR